MWQYKYIFITLIFKIVTKFLIVKHARARLLAPSVISNITSIIPNNVNVIYILLIFN